MQKLRFLPLISLLMLFISGCWDIDDLNQRATVIALGLDAAPNNMVLTSAQIALVETSPISLGAQTSEKPFHIITSQAQTSYGAVTGLENKAAKTIFLGQLKTVVINTALAERGLKEYCGFLQRFPQIAPQCAVVLTSTTSRDILGVSLSSKFLPGIAIHDFLMSKSKWDEAYPVEVWQFINNIESGPVDAFLPIISYDQEEQVYKSEGLGVFHRDRLVGKLSENESRMALLLMGKARSAYITVPVPQMGKITFRRVSAKNRIKILQTSPQVQIFVNVKINGVAADITSDKTNLQVTEIKEIERVTAASIKKDMFMTIQHLQLLNSDIIGFGEQIRADHPGMWRNLNWNEVYPHANIQVKVVFNLERVGEYR